MIKYEPMRDCGSEAPEAASSLSLPSGLFRFSSLRALAVKFAPGVVRKLTSTGSFSRRTDLNI
jgi:hypothetical protein